MEMDTFEQFLRLGDELQDDYGSVFGVGNDDHSTLTSSPFYDNKSGGDTLSLIMNDLDLPCSSSSSCGDTILHSSSSSPSECVTRGDVSHPPSHYTTNNNDVTLTNASCMYDDTLSLDPPLASYDQDEMYRYGYYEGDEDSRFASLPHGSSSSSVCASDDSGHHSPTTSFEASMDVESGFVPTWQHNNGQQHHQSHIQNENNRYLYSDRRSSIEEETTNDHHHHQSEVNQSPASRRFPSASIHRRSSSEESGDAQHTTGLPHLQLHHVQQKQQQQQQQGHIVNAHGRPNPLNSSTPQQRQQVYYMVPPAVKGTVAAVSQRPTTVAGQAMLATGQQQRGRIVYRPVVPIKADHISPAPGTTVTGVVRQNQVKAPTVLLAHTAPVVQYVNAVPASLVRSRVVPALPHQQQIKMESMTPSPPGTTTVPVMNLVETIEQNDDEAYMRKQAERKMKNRAAAQFSRLRRRTELEDLRTRVGTLSARNEELEAENGRLRKRVQELERQSNWAPPRKRATAAAVGGGICLMVFVMLFAFEPPLDKSLSPFKVAVPLITVDEPRVRVVRDAVEPSNSPNSRALMAIEDYDEKERMRSEAFPDYSEDVAKTKNVTTSSKGCGGGTTSKMYPNQTETIRLNKALDNWVQSHDSVDWTLGGGRRMLMGGGVSLMVAKRRMMMEEEEKIVVKSPHHPHPIMNSTSKSSMTSANDTSLSSIIGSTKEKKEHEKTVTTIKKKKKSPRGEAKREAARELAMRDRAWKHLDMVSSHGLRKQGPENRPDWINKSTVGGGMNDGRSANGVPTGGHRSIIGTEKEMEREWRDSYEKLASAVQQRTDTLYVVAMKDYFLLPAMDRNATSRPRVSLILPAMVNGTMADANNQVMLMRLDFEVVGTGLLRLAEGLLPLFQNLSMY